jgi:elongation factor P
LHFDETFGAEPAPHSGENTRPGEQPIAPFRVNNRGPKSVRRGVRQKRSRHKAKPGRGRIRLAFSAKICLFPQPTNYSSTKHLQSRGRIHPHFRGTHVRVIASSIRKGNIIEREDGQLCVVLSAESFHPGKGTPTTQIDMRRLSDGVKVTDRYKTTEQVERAFVEDKDFDFLYTDADGYHFMNTETYDQTQVPADVIGDQAQWLQEGMKVILSIFNSTPVAIQLPPRVTLEVADTEPAMKGQTASSSYKPAKMANGARVMVPPHIAVGVRIVIQTEDGSYVERAKD